MGNMNRRAKECRLGLKVISVHHHYSKSGYHYPPNESIAFGGISLLGSIIKALNSWGLIGIKFYNSFLLMDSLFEKPMLYILVLTLVLF